MMNAARIRFTLGFGILLALSTVACRGEVTAAAEEDAPTRDSLLVSSVLLANGDSAPIIDMSDDTIELGSAVDVAPVLSERLAPVVAAAPRTPRAPAPQRVVSPRIGAQPVAPQRATPQRPASPRAASSLATVPAGTRLTLEAGRRICVNTSKVGDTFTARLTRSLTVPGGTVIPSGARAVGEVSSLVGPMGEEDIRIVVRSVAVGSRTYNVSARVTNVELDRRRGAYRCIPDDGRIVAQLTAPLRIRL